ncbi:MAG: FtsX-like permease family protein [Candidatus Riflebacteria bacterium]|nr:FtsX-like permease family protein [Candidatus Riflebacteria bacterium]
MNDVFSNTIKELLRKPIRTGVNVFGYFLCCAFITIVALFLRFDLQAKDAVVKYMGGKFLIYSPVRKDGAPQAKTAKTPMSEGFFTEPMVNTHLMPVSLVKEIAAIDEVKAVTPFLLFRIKQGQDGHVFSLGGIKIEDKYALKSTMVSEADIIKGVFFNPNDRNVVVIDKSYADLWNLKPGSVVNVADALYPVIGVVSSHARTARADIYMNWEDAKIAINKRLTVPLGDEANIFLVASNGGEYNAVAMKKSRELLEGNLSANAVNCSLHIVDFMGLSKDTLNYVLMAACILVFLFSANSQWSLVSEKRHEIAILKAIGWKNNVIFGQIVLGSVLQSALGGALGAVVGVAVFPFCAAMLKIPFNAQYEFLNMPSLFAWVFVGIVVIAIVSALVPAFKAVRTSPADVLRN